MTEYNPQAEYEAEKAAHEEQRDRAALEGLRIESARSRAENAQLKAEFTCPLCGMPLELHIGSFRFLPSAFLEYGGEIACDCVTGESLPLLIVKGASQAEAERLAREKWNAMPHFKFRADNARLKEKCEALQELVEALVGADNCRKRLERLSRKKEDIEEGWSSDDGLPNIKKRLRQAKGEQKDARKKMQSARARLAEIGGAKCK